MSLQRITHWAGHHERHLSSGALVAGFIIDNLTFRRVDLLFDNLVLIFYLSVAAVAIALINLYEGEALRGKLFGWLYTWSPIVLQFAFGGLFSGFVVLYSRSASFIASWPFLLILASLLIGNEFFKKHYLRLTFQVSILFIGIFSFAIFSVPVFLRTMGDLVFLLSGALSLIIISGFLKLLGLALPLRMRQSKKALSASIITIFIGINILYFTNIIPPIPLALKDAGVYHYVGGAIGGYVVKYEEWPWYKALFFNPTIHLTPLQPVYVYSAVFAPTRLNTQIFHHWQYYDANKREWMSANRASFPIVGGRDGGYRGYSLKHRMFPGLWRVRIETARGQLIGRLVFNVEEVQKSPPLIEEIR